MKEAFYEHLEENYMKGNPYHFPIYECSYCGGKTITIKQYMRR